MILRIVINAIAFALTVALLPGLTVDGGAAQWAFVSAVFGIMNTTIRPTLKALSIPLRVASLGLSTVLVNGFIVYATAWLVDALRIDGGLGGQILRALGAAVVISIVSTAVSVVLPGSAD